jgi:hypothetical protein
MHAVTTAISCDGHPQTGADLDNFFQHDPEPENWARVKESNDVLVSMHDTLPLLQSLRGNTFFVADSDMLGTGPAAIQAGHRVCVLFGGKVQFVRRLVGEHYKS